MTTISGNVAVLLLLLLLMLGRIWRLVLIFQMCFGLIVAIIEVKKGFLSKRSVA